MAIKRKKKTATKPAKQKASNSGIITTILISAVIVGAAAAAGVVVGKIKSGNKAASNVSSTVSPSQITITDTKTGKSKVMEIMPASAGNVQAVTVSAQTAAAAVTVAASSGDFSRLLKPADTKETIPKIDIDEAKYLFDSGKAVFVDARGPAEFAESHVRGAVNVPAGATDEEIAKLKDELKGKVLVTYCHGIGCHLADKSAYKLWDAGYRKIAIFFGGWPKWNEHNYPLEKK